MAQGKSLSDSQIQSSFKAHQTFHMEALRKAQKLLEETKSLNDSDQMSISAESMRAMALSMLAMYKTITEPPTTAARASDHGDQGANCDYNPFNKINVGDPWD